MRLVLFNIFLVFSLFANSLDDSILSSNEKEKLLLKKEINQLISKQLKNAWIDPVILRASKMTNSAGSDFETKSTTYSINFSQDIFRSGGIYYAIKYANSMERLNNSLLKIEKNGILIKAYTLLLNIKKLNLEIKKQHNLIENKELEIKKQKEQFLSGLLDISFLNRTIIESNGLKNGLIELKNRKKEAISNFANISDRDPLEIELKPTILPKLEKYIKDNIYLKVSQNKIRTKNDFAKITKAKYLPKITINAGYSDDETEAEQFFMNRGHQSSYNYGISITWPLMINAFKESEEKRVDYLKSITEKRIKKSELENKFNFIKNRLESFRNKKEIALKNIELYNTLLEQIKEQVDVGLKTGDDLTIMKNSKQNSEIDPKIYDIEIELLKIEIIGELDEV